MRVDRSLRVGAAAPSEARQALTTLSTRVDGTSYDDLRLLVTELVTNSLRHGELTAGDTIDLGVVLAPGSVRVEVHDPGVGFGSAGAEEPLEDTRGWGLYLLGRIADRWGVLRQANGVHGTCVWFEIDLP